MHVEREEGKAKFWLEPVLSLAKMSSDVKPALLHDSRGSLVLGCPRLRRQQRQFLSGRIGWVGPGGRTGTQLEIGSFH